jgi:hypothetical protein
MSIMSIGMAGGYLLWLKEKATFGPPFLSGNRSSNDFATIILFATAALTSSYLFYFA